MKLEDLREFLFQVNLHGYGSNDITEEKLPNGEHIITFQLGDFESKDVYYGGEPYAGQLTIFYKEHAVWSMQYRGRVVQDENFSSVHDFLGKVLTSPKLGNPRGTDGFSDGRFTYSVVPSSCDLSEFTLSETINQFGNVIYSADFFGGLIDVRGENYNERL